MKQQNTFETKQKADELMEQAVALWKKSDRSEYLEGLEDDPVFRILMNAAAYQSNELDAEIETLKDELLEELVSYTGYGEGTKAIPATVTVSVRPVASVDSLPITGDGTFTLISADGGQFNFIPLLRSTVYNLRVKEVRRLDLRRWSVVTESTGPVSNLSGFSFAVSDASFHKLSVTIAGSGVQLPLISSGECQNLPMSDCFSLRTLMYNRSQALDAGAVSSGLTPYTDYIAMDLFAKSGIHYYQVKEMPDFAPTVSPEFIFEFDGISPKFDFRYPQMAVNVLILVNASIRSSTISKTNPVRRITGSTEDGGRAPQFLHLLPPGDWQNVPFSVRIRRISADRFNAGRLVRLLRNLLSKYHSDYYAFQSIGATSADPVMANIRRSLEDLMELARGRVDGSFEGVYAIMDTSGTQAGDDARRDSSLSFDVSYLVTDGAGVNGAFGQGSVWSAPQGLDNSLIKVEGSPEPGYDEVRDERKERMLARYYMDTRDRLVTMHDIRMFCLKELMVRFDISEGMIDSIEVSREPVDMGSWHTYGITVDIRLKSNEFARKAFDGDSQRVENHLQRTASVRMSGMYPLRVKFEISR